MLTRSITLGALAVFIGAVIYFRKNSDSSVFFASSKPPRMTTVCVIGGGLAGLSAALEAHAEAERKSLSGSRVLVIEKEPKTGGNSAKASSGINALNPLGGDSVEAFTEDTINSGGGLSDQSLVDILVVSLCLKITENNRYPHHVASSRCMPWSYFSDLSNPSALPTAALLVPWPLSM